mmetsp:Transcript_20077/g.32415  ORF Transcript_20077/g.32415 Transcript_20077/m.32415 type:complete len:423 (+) Transcript_20077:101-1369(+)
MNISDVLRGTKRNSMVMMNATNPMALATANPPSAASAVSYNNGNGVTDGSVASRPFFSGFPLPAGGESRMMTAEPQQPSALANSLTSAGRPLKRAKFERQPLPNQNESDDGAEEEGEEEEEGDQQQQDGVRFREYQAEIWSEKFEELCMFRRQHGHCHVPHHFAENPGLAQWVKRQRYQYKLKSEGKRSTLSDERVRLLNKIGFIWNSHDAVWEERLQDLMLFKQIHGHCIVPSNFEPNVQLAIWIKRQRRQYKKYQEGGASSMTPERIAKLEAIGFVWDCRKMNKKDHQLQQANDKPAVLPMTAWPNAAAAAATAAMNNALLSHQQQQDQVTVFQNRLKTENQLTVNDDSRLPDGKDEEGGSGIEGELPRKKEAGQVGIPATTNTASAIGNGSNGKEQHQQPLRIPKCEFFSFSRKFQQYL